jgi:hypothetical protein
MFAAMPARRYTEAEIDAAVDAITEPGRFREAESLIASAAPRLQRILAQALAEGGWFEESHDAEVAKAAGVEEESARIGAVRTLLAEEARMGMMVGVAVGWALAEELAGSPGPENDEED